MDANIINESEESDSLIIKKVRCPQHSGEGLPYAPVDWPNEGDIWGWKVGKRFDASSTFYQDRFLVVPKSLQPHRRARLLLRSKTSVKKFLQTEFPDADIDAFFASFSWKVPVKSQPEKKAIDTPSPRPRKCTKQDAVARRDTPGSQKYPKQEVVAPKDTPCPHPPKSTEQDTVAPKDPPNPQKSTKQKVVAPKAPPRPRKSIKLEAAKVGGSGTPGKITQKHVVHGQRTRKSSRLMGKFTTKYAGMLFDLTSESDETDA